VWKQGRKLVLVITKLDQRLTGCDRAIPNELACLWQPESP
jgi:hypothetical protein